jgi:hypothetical protein
MRLLQRPRVDGSTRERVERPVVLEVCLRPRLQHELHPFLEARAQLVEVHPELLHLLEVDAPADADLEPRAGEDIQHGRLLREPERLVERNHVDHGADADPLGAGGQRPQHDVRVTEEGCTR